MIFWQVQVDDRVINQSDREKLPDSCKWIKLILDGKVKLSIDVCGKPFYFIRHFFDYSLDSVKHTQEYHIGIENDGKITEEIYDPASEEIGCIGAMTERYSQL